MRPRSRRHHNGGGRLSPFVSYSAISSEVLASDSNLPDSASESVETGEEEEDGRTTTAATAASSSSEDEWIDEEKDNASATETTTTAGRAAEIASVAILDIALPILLLAAALFRIDNGADLYFIS